MSDDISIPDTGPVRTAYTHSYRSRNASMDSGTKRLLTVAGGLILVLLTGAAVWNLGFRHHSSGVDGVPMIEADTRPLRIKPDNPGGAAAGFADSGSPSAATGQTSLAPHAEQPDPNAIAGRQSPPPSAAQPAAPVVPAPHAAEAQPPAVARTAPPPVPDAKPATRIMVQLAAVGSEKDAGGEWRRLSQRMPDLLRDHDAVVQKADQGGKVFWRVRTSGFRDMADAAQFCKQVKAKGGNCTLASF